MTQSVRNRCSMYFRYTLTERSVLAQPGGVGYGRLQYCQSGPKVGLSCTDASGCDPPAVFNGRRRGLTWGPLGGFSGKSSPTTKPSLMTSPTRGPAGMVYGNMIRPSGNSSGLCPSWCKRRAKSALATFGPRYDTGTGP